MTRDVFGPKASVLPDSCIKWAFVSRMTIALAIPDANFKRIKSQVQPNQFGLFNSAKKKNFAYIDVQK